MAIRSWQAVGLLARTYQKPSDVKAYNEAQLEVILLMQGLTSRLQSVQSEVMKATKDMMEARQEGVTIRWDSAGSGGITDHRPHADGYRVRGRIYDPVNDRKFFEADQTPTSGGDEAFDVFDTITSDPSPWSSDMVASGSV